MKLLGITSLISLFVLTSCFSQIEESITPQVEDNAISQDSSTLQGDITTETVIMNEPEEVVIQQEATITEDRSGNVMLEETIIQTGTYESYSMDKIGNTENTVIFFAASWCPSCQVADRNLMSSDIPEGLTILKADFDSEVVLRQEYGVVVQHTFVSVDADGDQLRKWVGGTNIDDIIEKL
ncbi:thioredoxin family protein [Candidatus Gracilibacteria bacterium]|nr:thioredoxin family protein [Candidatus Gracilibacteria bacterium]